MVQLAEKLTPIATPQLLAALVRIGIAEFWHQTMVGDSSTATALQLEAALILSTETAPASAETPPTWRVLREQLIRQWPPRQGPLGRFLSEYRISLPRAFLLTLIGETESQHTVTLAVNELQSPNHSTRLSVHLAVALLNTLFDDSTFDALNLHDDWLIQTQLLRLHGEGPLPLRHLQMEPALWSVLSGRQQLWPGCKTIATNERQLLPARVRKQLPGLAALLNKGDVSSVAIRGNPGSGRALLAAELATTLGMQAIEVPLELWPQSPLLLACRYAGWLPVIRPPVGAGETWQAPILAIDIPHILLVGMDGAISGRDVLELELPIPEESERRQLWLQQLADTELAAHAAATALLSGPSIVKLARNAKLRAQQDGLKPTFDHIASARRELGAERLRLLAQPVSRLVHRDAVVFPPLVDQYLSQFIARSRLRESVWNGLGATLQASRNNGLRALFVGESGTGKTLAASYVATSLGAPLYRVDLAAIMNKYVGESEKNLGSLLDLAAAVDAVLLFDEADSLFGRRNDAKQGSERYANMLTNFLLTRIENHPGIAILTTNNRDRIDAAFTRRLDVIVEFPLPGFQERLQLWQSHLGQRSPPDGICRTLASYCDLTGGQIRNAVLTAACSETTASAEPIPAQHLVAAIQREYQKLGRTLPAQLEQLGK